MKNSQKLRYIYFTSVIFICIGIGLGCQDLAINNNNDPNRRRALSTPSDIVKITSSSWQSYWELIQQTYSSAATMPQFADAGNETYSSYMYGREPREPFHNNEASGFGLADRPWFNIFGGINNAVDGLKAIENDGIKIPPSVINGGEADSVKTATDMVRAFGWFCHGLLYSYVALIYDQASLVGLDTDLHSAEDLEYKPYPEVAEFAIKSLKKSIDIANKAPHFETPEKWMGSISVNNDRLARMAHSYIARLMVYLPRNPEERSQIDWGNVLQQANKGITEDFSPELSVDGIYSFLMNLLLSNFSTAMKADYRLIGPADVSGNYQDWIQTPVRKREAFLITTPDRRIVGIDSLTGKTNPKSDGTLFKYSKASTYGLSKEEHYFTSNYQWNGKEGGYSKGNLTILSVDEMNLLKAEAYIRKNNPQRSMAAELMNKTRVNNGKLPPVTASGPAKGSDCVPRTQDGTKCGSLLDALHYERLIELEGQDAWRTWYDRRGFGTLTPRTFEQLPVSYQELDAVGKQIYTFGGSHSYSADENINVE